MQKMNTENQSSKLIIANWKMNKTIGQALDFVAELSNKMESVPHKVGIAVPFTALWHAAEGAKGSGLMIGAQNINAHEAGAFTGEISSLMVKDAGASFVIIGHSERRTLFHEDNALVNAKVKRALKEGLTPLLCIGESASERKAGFSLDVLGKQLSECLSGIECDDFGKLIVAYEPFWSIGTGQLATLEIIREVHEFCKKMLFKPAPLAQVPVLYGGSVSKENCKELLEERSIDGLLVGGASLKLESFIPIVNCPIHSRSSL